MTKQTTKAPTSTINTALPDRSIQLAPAGQTPVPHFEIPSQIVDKPENLNIEIDRAIMAKRTFIETTPEVLQWILNGGKGDYIIIRGVAVFAEGTRDTILAKDAINVF